MKTDLIIIILSTIIALCIIIISQLLWYIKFLKEINKDQVAEIHRSYRSYDRLVDVAIAELVNEKSIKQ